MQEMQIEYIIDIGLQDIPSTKWQKLLGSAAMNNSYWHRPRNKLRLSADDGGGYCDFMLDNNGGGQL